MSKNFESHIKLGPTYKINALSWNSYINNKYK